MEYLIIAAIGNNQAEILTEMTKLAAKNDCTIENSRGTLLGGEFAILMQVGGNWSSIAKVEANLPALQKQLNILTVVKRAQSATVKEKFLPYAIQIVGLDQPDVIHELCVFLVKQTITIVDLQCNTYLGSPSGTRMLLINIAIAIPAQINISSLREQFMILCDALNIDGILEPERH